MNEALIKEKKTDGFMMIENDIAFPSLKRLAADMGVSVKTIVVYRKILISYGLIKRIIRRRDENRSYQTTLYQLVRFESSIATEEDIDEDEPVVSEGIDADNKIMRKPDFTKTNNNLAQELKKLGVSTNSIKHLLSSYPESAIRRKLYLLREKSTIHSPGSYLFSVLRNDYANKEDAHSSLDEITSNEINEINRSERIARRIYYQKMEEDRLPKEESLKWIRKIKEQLRDEKMRCQPEN